MTDGNGPIVREDDDVALVTRSAYLDADVFEGARRDHEAV